MTSVDHYARRQRLFRPVNGRTSSELEVVPRHAFRRGGLPVKPEPPAPPKPQLSPYWYPVALRLHRWPGDKRRTENSVTVPKILRAVATYYGVPQWEIKSQRRLGTIVRPRHVTYYLCRELTPRSFPSIAKALGGKDHTTIMHGWRKIEGLIPICPEIAAEVEAIQRSLHARSVPTCVPIEG